MKDRAESLKCPNQPFFLRFDDGRASYPAGLGLAANGDLIIANSLGHSVCRVSPTRSLERIAGSGVPGFVDAVGAFARFNNPNAIAVAPDGTIFVADCDNHAIRAIDPSTETVTTFAGQGRAGVEDGIGREATLRSPRGLAFDRNGDLLVATMHGVRRIAPDGEVTTVVRNGLPGKRQPETRLGFLGGIAVDPRYGILATDTTHHAIWRIDSKGDVHLIAGGNGSGCVDGRWDDAAFNKPRGIVVDRIGRVFVADSKNDALRVLLPSGVTATVRGETISLDDGFDYPTGIAMASDGSVYVADQLNNRVFQIAL